MRCVPITPVSPRKPAAKAPPRGSRRSIASPPYPSARPRGKQRPIHSSLPSQTTAQALAPCPAAQYRNFALDKRSVFVRIPRGHCPRKGATHDHHHLPPQPLPHGDAPNASPTFPSASPLPQPNPQPTPRAPQPSTMFHNVPPPQNVQNEPKPSPLPPGHLVPWPPAVPSKRNPPKRPKPRQHVLNNSAQSLIFESFIPRRSLGLEMGGGCSAAAGAVAAESIAGGLGHG